MRDAKGKRKTLEDILFVFLCFVSPFLCLVWFVVLFVFAFFFFFIPLNLFVCFIFTPSRFSLLPD